MSDQGKHGRNKPPVNGTHYGASLAIGIAIGATIGVVMDNVGMGIGIGIAIGIALAPLLGKSGSDRDDDNNKS